MSSQILVLYSTLNPSDIKAIDTKPNTDGTHTVWHGHKDSRLHTYKLTNMSLDEWYQEQMRNGFDMAEGIIDCETGRVSFVLDHDNSAVLKPSLKPIPSNLWFRVSSELPLEKLRAAMDHIHSQLVDEHSKDADRLFYLPVYRELYNGTKNSGAEYSEGPLALLLLFALRRHFRGSASPSDYSGGELFQVSDDSNNLLPDDFDDLGAYLMEMCEAWLVRLNRLEEGASLTSGDSVVFEAAKAVDASHYTSVKSIEKIATAMGCLEARIDLSATPTKVENAFF